MVQHIMILHNTILWQEQNINHFSKSQKTPHTSPLRARYEVSFMRILENIDHVIMAPQCIWISSSNTEQYCNASRMPLANCSLAIAINIYSIYDPLITKACISIQMPPQTTFAITFHISVQRFEKHHAIWQIECVYRVHKEAVFLMGSKWTW